MYDEALNEYKETHMSTKEFISYFLVGLAVFVLVMSLLVVLPWHVHSINKEKTQHSIEVCVDHGYAGFFDSSGDSGPGSDKVGCYRAGENH